MHMQEETQNEIQNSRSKKNNVIYAAGFLVLVAIACLLYWLVFIRGTVFSNDARIEGTLVDLSPQISGVLKSVSVQEGDHVKKDQLLFALDKGLLEASVARAKADVMSAGEAVDVAGAQYSKAVHGPLADEIKIAQTAVSKAQSELRLEEANWKRISALYEEKLVSTADRDKVNTALEMARHKYDDALERLEFLKKGTRSEDLKASKESMEVRKAELESARARQAQSEINLGYSDVLSPFAGIIVRRWKDPGDTIQAGTPVFSILDPASLYIKANIEEKDLYKVHEGDRVDIRIDAFPGAKLKGRVEKILLATNSKFSLIPSEGVSGTFIKVTQRIPLKIAFDSAPNLPLGPGLSVEVRIHCRKTGQVDTASGK
jgi:membrane fusion protein (multidrug efflux system)